MRLWKQQLNQTHRVCKFSLFILLCVICFIPACKKKDFITVRAFLQQVYDKGGFIQEDLDPFQHLEKLAIIDQQILRRLDEDLTREICAFVLANYMGDLKYESLEIKDIDSSIYRKQIQQVVAWKIIEIEQDKFYPNDYVSLQQAQKYLELAHQMWKSQPIEQVYKIETLPVKSISDFTLEQNSLMTSQLLKEGEIVDLDQSYYRIIKKYDDFYEVEQLQSEDLIQYLEVGKEFTIDFDEVEILPNESLRPPNYVNQSFSFHETIGNDIQLNIDTSGQQLLVDLRKLNHGRYDLYATFLLSQLKPKFYYRFNHGNIEEMYFKLQFQTSQSFGVGKKYMHNRTENLANFSLEQLKHIFEKQNPEDIDLTIPICKIRIPVPQMPLIQLYGSLNLVVGATGKMELSFSSSNEFGFVYKDNHLRLIKDFKPQNQNRIEAQATIKATTLFALQAYPLQLMDVSVDVGASAIFQSQLRRRKLYEIESLEIDVPPDLVQQSKTKKDVVLCSDVMAKWLLQLGLNQNSMLAKRIGLATTIDLLNDQNRYIFHNQHFENFMKVDECTLQTPHIIVTEKNKKMNNDLELYTYSLILKPQETGKIKIKQLPNENANIQYKSENNDIVEIDQGGNYRAKSKGNTVLVVETSDHQFQKFVHVMVR